MGTISPRKGWGGGGGSWEQGGDARVINNDGAGAAGRKESGGSGHEECDQCGAINSRSGAGEGKRSGIDRRYGELRPWLCRGHGPRAHGPGRDRSIDRVLPRQDGSYTANGNQTALTKAMKRRGGDGRCSVSCRCGRGRAVNG